MILSNTSEYALRILAFMSKNEDELYSAKYLVDTLQISDKYLRRLMTVLTKAGFIYSVQGRDGGYRFAKSTNEIYLGQIIDAVEGIDKYTSCVLGFDKCSDENPCAMHATWISVRDEFVKVFANNTLKSLDMSKIYKLWFFCN